MFLFFFFFFVCSPLFRVVSLKWSRILTRPKRFGGRDRLEKTSTEKDDVEVMPPKAPLRAPHAEGSTSLPPSTTLRRTSSRERSSSMCGSLFLLCAIGLSVSHYFAATRLPISDSDETFNFVEPIHFLFYGTGKQTWENCNHFCLRNWFFTALYAAPGFLRYRVLPLLLRHIGFSSSTFLAEQSFRSVDVYFFQRVTYGQIACLTEIFFARSIDVAYAPKPSSHSRPGMGLIALMLLLTSSAVPHAAVSALPTSFAMLCFFLVLGCWLRSGVSLAFLLNPAQVDVDGRAPAAATASSTTFLSEGDDGRVQHSYSPIGAEEEPAVFSTSPSSSGAAQCYAVLTVTLLVVLFLVGWPFAGLIGAPIALDLLLRYPSLFSLSTFIAVLFVAPVVYGMDSFFFCQPAFSVWNLILYNALGGGDATLYGTEPWFFFYKNLLVNFHFVFLLALLSPLVVLLAPRRAPNFIRQSRTDLIKEVLEPMRTHVARPDSSELQKTKDSRTTQPTAWMSTLTTKRCDELRHVARLLRYTPVHSPCAELAYVSTFYIWFLFWHFIPHKEERFMAPAYPSLVLCATITLSRILLRSASDAASDAEAEQLWWVYAVICSNKIPRGTAADGETTTTSPHTSSRNPSSSGEGSTVRQRHERTADPTLKGSKEGSHRRCDSRAANDLLAEDREILHLLVRPRIATWRWFLLAVFFVLTGALSLSRAAALHHFYGAPQQLLYDVYPLLADAAETKWREHEAQLSTSASSALNAAAQPSNTTATTATSSSSLASASTSKTEKRRTIEADPGVGNTSGDPSMAAPSSHAMPLPAPLDMQAPTLLKESEESEEENRFLFRTATPTGYESPFVFHLCVGREWYRFPSTFFLRHYVPTPSPQPQRSSPHPVMHLGFLRTSAFYGALPLDFTRYSPRMTGVLNDAPPTRDTPRSSSYLMDALLPERSRLPRACTCGSLLVNDLNLAIDEQYIGRHAAKKCDVVLDSLPSAAQRYFELARSAAFTKQTTLHPDAVVEELPLNSTNVPATATPTSSLDDEIVREGNEVQLEFFPFDIRPPRHPGGVGRYRLLDTSRTPMWCRVLYYPFGITERCAVWRDLVLQAKRDWSRPPDG